MESGPTKTESIDYKAIIAAKKPWVDLTFAPD